MTGNSWEDQLEQWRQWLAEHRHDPAVIAAAQRIGRNLTGGSHGHAT